jgi:hypothetical protein
MFSSICRSFPKRMAKDREIHELEKYTALPSIYDHGCVHNGTGRMITVGRVKVDRIPDYFMVRYDDEIEYFARNWKDLEMHNDDPNQRIKSIFLREGYFSNRKTGYLSNEPLNEEQGPEALQVKLLGKMSRRGVEIEPYRKVDEVLIAKHCAKLMRLGISARAQLVEPERPWLPFMPRIGKANGG